jgi:hypothetical protein
MLALGAVVVFALSAALVLVLLHAPESLLPAVVAAVGASILSLTWAYGRARSAAMRAEVVRSFAGLAVVHSNRIVVINQRNPLIGEWGSRYEAAKAAMQAQDWCVLVRAWDRYYVLRAAPAPSQQVPVSFRSRAVADIVPASQQVPA